MRSQPSKYLPLKREKKKNTREGEKKNIQSVDVGAEKEEEEEEEDEASLV